MQEHDSEDMGATQSNIPSVRPKLVRISEVARLSAIFALAGPILLVGLMLPVGRSSGFVALGVLAVPILSAIAFILGLIGLISIGFSGGRRTGYVYAITGVSVPLAEMLLVIYFIWASGIRDLDRRMECGTNLSGIGKAMLLYANDNDDALPRAGGRRGTWAARTPSWAAPSRQSAYGLSEPNAEDGRASISASLYLLVKYTEVTPKILVCTDDKGTTVLNPTAYGVDSNTVDLWDFGPNPPKHCSYAYHMVYGAYPLTVSSPPGFAVAADRNPWMDSLSAKARDFSAFQPDIPPFNGTGPQGLAGNTFRHDGQGQNVVFLDTHVEWEQRPYCSTEDDNIYTSWDGPDKARGVPPKLGSAPADARDSLLVNDPVGPSR